MEEQLTPISITPKRSNPGSRHYSPCIFDDDEEEFGIACKRRKTSVGSDWTIPDSPISVNSINLLREMEEADMDMENDRAIAHKRLMAIFCTSGDDSITIDSSMASSSRSSAPGSPMTPRNRDRALHSTRYTKHELWASIQSDYQYLMDDEIIETCKSTESDLSWDSDDAKCQNKVSFTEFLQQYKELSDWLDGILRATQRQCSSLSERYLNQSYYEEMLNKSPRKKLFNDYARQLLRRYPSMKEEINARIHHINVQWQSLEKAVSPLQGSLDEQSILTELEQDLVNLQKWLHEVESALPRPLLVSNDWPKDKIQMKLVEHKNMQIEIESHSKFVTAVLRLCERLSESGKEKALQSRAKSLEKQWHTVWLHSLEWQCRLEEALVNQRQKRETSPDNTLDDSDWLKYTVKNDTMTSTTQTDSNGYSFSSLNNSLVHNGTQDISNKERDNELCCSENKGIENGDYFECYGDGNTCNSNGFPLKQYCKLLNKNKNSELRFDKSENNHHDKHISQPEMARNETNETPGNINHFADNSFYRMTSVEPLTDTEPSSSADKALDVEQNDMTDIDSEYSFEYSSEDISPIDSINLSGGNSTKNSDLNSSTELKASTPMKYEEMIPLKNAPKCNGENIHLSSLKCLNLFQKDILRSSESCGRNPDDICDASAEGSLSTSDSDAISEAKKQSFKSSYNSVQSNAVIKNKCIEFQRAGSESPRLLSKTSNPPLNNFLSLSDSALYDYKRDLRRATKRHFPKSKSEDTSFLPIFRDINHEKPKPNRTRRGSYRGKPRKSQNGSKDSISPRSGRKTLPRSPLKSQGSNLSLLKDMVLSSESEMVTPLNSTIESFSENAWDMYQDPLYSGISEDPTEEKLDASHISADWDNNLEFEEDFHFDSNYGSGIADHKKGLPGSKVEKKMVTVPSVVHTSAFEESDSDLEDFRDVVEESIKAMHFTESTLQKLYKDPMDTGISYDPSEYSEPLATCQTNIKCLQEVVHTLNTEDVIATVGDEEIQDVLHMIKDWKDIESLAKLRLAQSELLNGIVLKMRSVKQANDEVKNTIESSNRYFESPSEIEDKIKELQQVRQDLLSDIDGMAQCSQSIEEFKSAYPDVNMQKCTSFQTELIKNAGNLASLAAAKGKELQTALLYWLDFIEAKKSVGYNIQQCTQQLLNIEKALSIATPEHCDMTAIQKDLQLMADDFKKFEEAIQTMSNQCNEVKQISSSITQDMLLSQITALKSATSDLQNRHLTVVGAIAAFVATKNEDSLIPQQVVVTNADVRSSYALSSSTIIPIAIVCCLGLLFLLYFQPEDGSFVFSPQLNYIRGPPPI